MNYLFIFAGIQNLAQNTVPLNDKGSEATEISLNFIDLAFKGGWIMIQY